MTEIPRPGEIWCSSNGRLYYFINRVCEIQRFADESHTTYRDTIGIWFRYLGRVSFIKNEDEYDGFSYIEGFEEMQLKRYS